MGSRRACRNLWKMQQCAVIHCVVNTTMRHAGRPVDSWFCVWLSLFIVASLPNRYGATAIENIVRLNVCTICVRKLCYCFHTLFFLVYLHTLLFIVCKYFGLFTLPCVFTASPLCLTVRIFIYSGHTTYSPFDILVYILLFFPQSPEVLFSRHDFSN